MLAVDTHASSIPKFTKLANPVERFFNRIEHSNTSGLSPRATIETGRVLPRVRDECLNLDLFDLKVNTT